MAAAETPLPEGTDHIINGASTTDETSGAAHATGGEAGTAARGAFFEKFDEVKAQGYDRAREYALVGKDRTTGALDDFVRMINDAAGQVDAKVGAQYGDYARRAADGLASFNDALKGKDVDDLFNEAREMVAKAPAIAVGTAAALGFIVARLAKAGLETPSDKDAPSA
ncbi:hypothetical protein HL653_12670 [Sphingomonas sp. AP4-R1]|uniref:hypothetical protein n=1 Tax=Sphingomonas sp. AP4-R1 TaxID=2735134 RepID=UPI0014939789|nr:hypothetical protein [Sphingomonas sp. AP4-R1]QJU58502.1 hypothetical protein HL653_12670 [Sphingomonas sp. AP4-R1]